MRSNQATGVFSNTRAKSTPRVTIDQTTLHAYADMHKRTRCEATMHKVMHTILHIRCECEEEPHTLLETPVTRDAGI